MNPESYHQTLVRFANSALQGLCANNGIVFGDHKCPEHPADCAGSIAKAAFDIAEQMMKELRQRQTDQ